MPELKLDSNVQYLKGVGPRRASALASVGIETVGDLLGFLPRRYLDRSVIVPIGSLKANMNATIIGKVLGKGILKGRRPRLEVILGDDTGYISLIWFSGFKFLEKMFNKGDIFSVTGEVTYFQQRQIVHPEVERIESEDARLIHTGRIVPVYPSTSELKKAGITGRAFRQMIDKALEMIGDRISDYLPEQYLKECRLMPFYRAIQLIHYPEILDDSERARKRLAFDELLELQYLILGTRKDYNRSEKGYRCREPGVQVKNFCESLPFRLTADQKKATQKIFLDMQKARPMHRLLQGDVGCGKTVVALLAAVYAAENRLQVALIAPTEMLAEQHYSNWKGPLEAVDISTSLITGSVPKPERRKAEESVRDGNIQVVFGTHAVISESIRFKRLGLAVIDEQHRFGVMQRGRLVGKGTRPDILVMSATPIPRSLAMTLYGDLDISSVRSMPPGRRPVRTVWRAASARPEIYKYLRSRLKAGSQIFFVYPLVEKSEKMDLQAAEEEYQRLKNDIFADFRVGLVHGRIKREKRDEIVRLFRERQLDVLVATTVIEVGIDIPSAAIMVIEHAERFGLSQLHQLRGRVGRGGQQGMAIAVASSPISDIARKRLDMFQSSSDGFKIAEADLKLRGPGDFFGTRQHGLPGLKVADLSQDTDLLPVARDIVIRLLAADRTLDAARRLLLIYLENKAKKRRRLARVG
jgi:ATP-dependent DNA helicase RecG